MDYNILASRFRGAPSAILSGVQYATIELAVLQEYDRLHESFGCVTKVVEGDPYPCNRTMWSDVEDGGVLKVRDYPDDESFGLEPSIYTKFRAIHDWHHCFGNLSFDFEDEVTACLLMQHALRRHSDDNIVRQWVRSVLIYQVACYNAYGFWDEGLTSKIVLEDLTYDL